MTIFFVFFFFSFPDVMMPSYAISKWYAIFFISYLANVLYVLMNLVSIGLEIIQFIFIVTSRSQKLVLKHKRHLFT